MKRIWLAVTLASLVSASASADEMTGGATGAGTTGYTGGYANGSTTFNASAGQSGNAASTGYITPWQEMAAGDKPTACLDIQSFTSISGRIIQMWSCDGDASQSWKLTPSGQIVGIDGKCLEVMDNNWTPGQALDIDSCNGSESQQWTWSPIDHTIRGITGGLCLSTPPGSNIYSDVTAGWEPMVETCNPSVTQQQWMIHGVTEIRSSESSDTSEPCFAVSGRGSFVACTGDPSQKWVITPDGYVVNDDGNCLIEYTIESIWGGHVAKFNYAELTTCASGISTWKASGSTLELAGTTTCLSNVTGTALVQPCATPDDELVFSTPDTVPLLAQYQSEWCWAAAAEMLTNYTGINTSLPECEEVNRHLGLTDCCTSASAASTTCNQPDYTAVWGATSVLAEEGYTYTLVNSPPSFAALGGMLPMGFDVEWPDGDGGHVMVVIGTDVAEDGSGWVLINDPWGVGAGDQIAMPYTYWQNPSTNPTQEWTFLHGFYNLAHD